jgi:hypothetical protein
MDLVLEHHPPQHEPQAFVVIAAALGDAGEEHALPRLLRQAEETWELEVGSVTATKVKPTQWWKRCEAVSAALDKELQEGEGPATAGPEEGREGDAAAAASAAAKFFLSVLLEPRWWESTVADQMGRSVVLKANGGEPDAAAEKTLRQRTFLTTCLWLESFAAVAKVGGGCVGGGCRVFSKKYELSSLSICKASLCRLWWMCCTCWPCIWARRRGALPRVRALRWRASVLPADLTASQICWGATQTTLLMTLP